jgi:hypothetical protein
MNSAIEYAHRKQLTPEYFYKRNLVVFLAEAETNKPYTISAIQSVCRVGYNQAYHTLIYGVKKNILAHHKNGERWFTVTNNQLITGLE